jgi:hypothetical protein
VPRLPGTGSTADSAAARAVRVDDPRVERRQRGNVTGPGPGPIEVSRQPPASSRTRRPLLTACPERHNPAVFIAWVEEKHQSQAAAAIPPGGWSCLHAG